MPPPIDLSGYERDEPLDLSGYEREIDTSGYERDEPVAPPQRGAFMSLVDKATAPITDLPSRIANTVAEPMMAYGEKGNSLLEKGSLLGGAFLQGIGNTVTAMTSPADIAAAALTGGGSLAMKQGLRGANALRTAGRAASVAPMLHGGELALNPMNDATLAERALGAAEGIAGYFGVRGAKIPAMTAAEDLPPIPNVRSNPENLLHVPDLPEYNAAPTNLPDLETYLVTGNQANPDKKLTMGALKGVKSAVEVTDNAGNVIARPVTNQRPIVRGEEAVAPGSNSPPPLTNKGPDRLKAARVKVDKDGKFDLTDPETNAVINLSEARKTSLDDAARSLDELRNTPVKVDGEPSMLRKAYDLSRGMLSVDLPFITSAGLRQARRAMANKEWFKAWVPSVKTYGSENAAKAHTAALMQNKYFKRGLDDTPSIAEQYGIKLSDIDGKYTAREDAIRGGLAEKIPVLGQLSRASNRSYNAFLNDIRVNLFDSRMEAAMQYYKAAKESGTSSFFGRKLSPEQIEELNPMRNKMLGEQIATQVMELTGRGKLETKIPFRNKPLSIEKHRDLMNSIMFSPGNTAAQLQMFDPRKYIMTSPTVRRQYLRGLMAWGASTAAMNGAAEMLGMPNVEMNPTSSDFLKPRFGDARFDTSGGVGQYMTALSRLVSGETTQASDEPGGEGKTKTLGEGFKADTAGDIVSRMATNKLHPVLRFAYDLATVSENKTFPVGDKILQMFVPMIAQDAAELSRVDPALNVLLPALSAGVGGQVYDKDFKDNLFFGEDGMTGIPDLNLETIAPFRLMRGQGLSMK